MMKNKTLLAMILVNVLLTVKAFAGGTVVVNSNNANAIEKSALSSLFLGKQNFWGDGGQVVVAVLKSDADADSTLKEITGMSGSRFKNHWQRLAFSGRGQMPKQFSDSASLIEFVKSNEKAIGIVPDSADLSAVKLVN